MNNILYTILVILMLAAIAGLALEVRWLRKENARLQDLAKNDQNIISRQSIKIRAKTNELDTLNVEFAELKAENRRLRSAGKME